MRKFWMFLLVLAFPGLLFAADQVQDIGTNKNLDGAMLIGALNGNAATVRESGAVAVSDKAKPKRITGSGLIYAGECSVQSVNMYSSTAGDLIGVYNATGDTLSPAMLEFEVGISANTTNSSYDAKGAVFTNGVYIVSSNANAINTASIDY